MGFRILGYLGFRILGFRVKGFQELCPQRRRSVPGRLPDDVAAGACDPMLSKP